METFHWTKCSLKSVFRLLLHTKKKNGSFKNCLLEGSLRNQNVFFYGIAAKPPIFMNYFMLISGGDPTCGISRRLSSLAIAMEISEEEVPITAVIGWTG